MPESWVDIESQIVIDEPVFLQRFAVRTYQIHRVLESLTVDIEDEQLSVIGRVDVQNEFVTPEESCAVAAVRIVTTEGLIGCTVGAIDFDVHPPYCITVG